MAMTARGTSERVPVVATRRASALHRHVLSILDLSPGDVLSLCRRAISLKHAPADPRTLRGRTVGVYFRRSSTRTRLSFLVGAGRLGATTVAFGPDDLQTTTGETLEDTARVLAGYLDVLVMRTHDSIEEMKIFAAHTGMSVVNALSDDEHPTQALADLTTLLEHFGRLEGLSVLYCGEGNTTAAALALAMSRIPGMRLVVATPEGYGLDPRKLSAAQALGEECGATIEETHDLATIRTRVDAVYTSRWQEMGVNKADSAWKQIFEPFRVTQALMERVAGEGTVVMHDLPAVRGEDIEAAILDGRRSLAWVQAQHKMFSAMAVLEWCGGAAAEDDS